MIAISFTLKDQDFDQIKETVKPIFEKHQGEPLVNAFWSQYKCDQAGVPGVVPRMFENSGLSVRNFYSIVNDAPLRDLMVKYVKDNEGTAYIIGNAIDGVKEERDAYLAAGVKVVDVELV